MSWSKARRNGPCFRSELVLGAELEAVAVAFVPGGHAHLVVEAVLVGHGRAQASLGGELVVGGATFGEDDLRTALDVPRAGFVTHVGIDRATAGGLVASEAEVVLGVDVEAVGLGSGHTSDTHGCEGESSRRSFEHYEVMMNIDPAMLLAFAYVPIT